MVQLGRAGGLSSVGSWKWREAEHLSIIKNVGWIGLEDVLNVEVKGQLGGWGHSLGWEARR